MLVVNGGSDTETNDVQPEKRRLLMVVTDGGSDTETNDLQP